MHLDLLVKLLTTVEVFTGMLPFSAIELLDIKLMMLKRSSDIPLCGSSALNQSLETQLLIIIPVIIIVVQMDVNALSALCGSRQQT